MIEQILNEYYVKPKVELDFKEYNRLMNMAKTNAKKIEKLAREIYEKEGVTKIEFEGNIRRKRYGEIYIDKYEFTVDCSPYFISPTGENKKTLYMIQEESRQKIAKSVKNYVEKTFASYFGEHMLKLNEIERLKQKQNQYIDNFLIVTVVGWMLAIVMCIAIFMR